MKTIAPQFEAIDRLFDALFTPPPRRWVFYTRDARNASCNDIQSAGPYVERGRFATEELAKIAAEAYAPLFPDCFFWAFVGFEDDDGRTPDEIDIFRDSEWQTILESQCWPE